MPSETLCIHDVGTHWVLRRIGERVAASRELLATLFLSAAQEGWVFPPLISPIRFVHVPQLGHAVRLTSCVIPEGACKDLVLKLQHAAGRRAGAFDPSASEALKVLRFFQGGGAVLESADDAVQVIAARVQMITTDGEGEVRVSVALSNFQRLYLGGAASLCAAELVGTRTAVLLPPDQWRVCRDALRNFADEPDAVYVAKYVHSVNEVISACPGAVPFTH